MIYPRFELWVLLPSGVQHKPRDKGDHTGFAPTGAIRGWARIEQRAVVLIRTDKADQIPIQVKVCYGSRFPNKRLEDRIDFHRRVAEAVYLNRVERHSSKEKRI